MTTKKAASEGRKRKFLGQMGAWLADDREARAQGKRAAESAIARRLAEKFQPTGNFHGAKSEVSAADVGWFLDVNEEEVEQLLDVGLLKTTGATGYTTVFEVERFLAVNPWWFKLRRQINAKAFAERLEHARAGGALARAVGGKAQPGEAAA